MVDLPRTVLCLHKLRKTKQSIDAFLKLMQGTSIDCQLFNPDSCITPVGTSEFNVSQLIEKRSCRQKDSN
jgi:hypothetical protein